MIKECVPNYILLNIGARGACFSLESEVLTLKPIRNIWKKAQKAAAALLILSSFCQMTPVYADNEEQGSSGDEVFHVEVVNNVSVDDINISLAEYELGLDGLERPFTQNQFVLPGQHVSKIVRITNVARSAWIRIKPDFAFADGMEGVDESMFVLADDNWIKRGEYWYYLKPVPTGESIDFIKVFCLNNNSKNFYIRQRGRI